MNRRATLIADSLAREAVAMLRQTRADMIECEKLAKRFLSDTEAKQLHVDALARRFYRAAMTTRDKVNDA